MIIGLHSLHQSIFTTHEAILKFPLPPRWRGNRVHDVLLCQIWLLYVEQTVYHPYGICQNLPFSELRGAVEIIPRISRLVVQIWLTLRHNEHTGLVTVVCDRKPTNNNSHGVEMIGSRSISVVSNDSE